MTNKTSFSNSAIFNILNWEFSCVEKLSENHEFIAIKKIIATFLVPIFLILAIYSLTSWILGVINPGGNGVNSFVNINNIFFEHFFTVLIFADVLILLFSFYITDDFHKVIRNSGFIISTILIRLSFSNTGLINNILILCAIIFGLLILLIHKT